MLNILSIIAGLMLLFPTCSQGKNKNNPFPSDIHVVLVGFDGWGSYSMEKADMPILKQMMKEGSWTLRKRSVLPSSSAANWASMFMGASPEIHGFTQWNSKTPEIPSAATSEGDLFPTISRILRSQRKDAEMGLFCHWAGIKYLADTLAMNRVVQIPVSKKKDKFSELSMSICNYIITKKPTFCTVVYDYPDHYGHKNGFESDEYYQSLNDLDCCLGLIVQSVKDAGIYDKTIFIVSSDHGGNEKKHGDKTLREMESPFVIFGFNIKKNYEIEEFMMQYDIASTIAYIFGLETPQVWIGRPVVSVFEKTR